MNVFIFFRRISSLCVVLLVPSLLTSCGMSGAVYNDANAAVASQRGEGAAAAFRQDQQRTVTQGTGLGAGLGALAGGIIGHQRGRGIEGALLGGLLGGGMGNVYGRNVATKKALATLSDVNLDACIMAAAEQNQAVRNRSAALRRELAGIRAQIARARVQGDNRSLAQARNRLQGMQQEADSSMAEVSNEINQQRQVGRQLANSPLSGQYSRRLQSGITSMSGARSEMEGTRSQIASTLTTF